jgi:FtsP/CotA-like multicopper oxidase with cupredoxin domain
MRTAYRVLAFAIAAMVAIQVGAIGYAVFAQLNWIEKGGMVDEAAFDTGVPGTGAYMFHALFAGVVLLASLAMLIISFFAKIPQGVTWAVIVLVCTVVQIALGTLSHMLAAIGAVHGAVALVLFGVAVMAAMRARKPAAVEEPAPAEVLQRPTTPIMAGRSTRVRLVVAAIATLAVLAPLAWLWQSSLVGKSYSVMGMGYLDYGGGPVSGHNHGASARSVSDIVVDPARKADVRVDLVAEQQNLTIGGRSVPGYTINGTSPGPTITAREGQLAEVHVRNASVKAGIALHWHGYGVPAAMDGVAGVTQDEIPVGGEFIYRFLANEVGTYWYHSHQVSNEQVIGGLFGTLVVLPKTGRSDAVDVTAAAHTYVGMKTINGVAGDLKVPAKPGQQVRVRLINTDNGPIETWADTPFRVLAIDGYAVNGPTDVTDRSVTVTAGGRADLGITMPSDGRAVRVQVSKGTAVILGADDPAAPPQPSASLDLLSYGSPTALGFDRAQANRSFDYSIGRRPGFVRGTPGLWWSINGHLYPHVPMYAVHEGDIVIMHIDNHSGKVHPMHLHGHHAVVLSRNGVAATGSPWWMDSVNVLDGERYDIAFVANNPGIWLDHCHHLKHAEQGMVAHLMYEGVSTPYRIGGTAGNQPE